MNWLRNAEIIYILLGLDLTIVCRKCLEKLGVLTALAANAATAATPSVLNISDPIIVPTPMSDSATNVLITLVKSSGVVVAVAIKVAAATSFRIVNLLTVSKKYV